MESAAGLGTNSTNSIVATKEYQRNDRKDGKPWKAHCSSQREDERRRFPNPSTGGEHLVAGCNRKQFGYYSGPC